MPSRLSGGAGGESGTNLQEEIEVKTAVQQKEGQQKQAHDYILHHVPYNRGGRTLSRRPPADIPENPDDVDVVRILSLR